MPRKGLSSPAGEERGASGPEQVREAVFVALRKGGVAWPPQGECAGLKGLVDPDAGIPPQGEGLKRGKKSATG